MIYIFSCILTHAVTTSQIIISTCSTYEWITILCKYKAVNCVFTWQMKQYIGTLRIIIMVKINYNKNYTSSAVNWFSNDSRDA